MTRVFASADDVRASVGELIGPSAPFPIPQELICAFADATDDHQWIHTDEERASTGPYGTTIAHGFLTLSLIPQFGRQLFSLEFGTSRFNYGINRARFPAPVRAGERLRASVTFVETTEAERGLLLTARYVLTGYSEKPACVAETLVLVS